MFLKVSFPGGMLDTKDKNLEQTALRETQEELGIPEYNIDVWGTGKLVVSRGETCILPVIGRIKRTLEMSKLQVNKSEVEEVFAVSLESLCDPTKLAYTQFRGAYSAPVYLGGQRRIWGLTALITNMFLRSLLPSKAYTHRIKYIPTVSRFKL